MNRVRYPSVPQRVARNAILLFFPVKFNICRKKSSTQFLCVTTSSSKVVATSFLYLTVHRRIAGDVPIYLKFAHKVTHPFRKRWFWQISLNSDAAVRASKKSSNIANRKPTIRFPSSHRRTLCVAPKSPKGGSIPEFLHLALPFISSLEVIIDVSNLMWVEHQPTDDKPSLKWTWPGHVTHFKVSVPWNSLSYLLI